MPLIQCLNMVLYNSNLHEEQSRKEDSTVQRGKGQEIKPIVSHPGEAQEPRKDNKHQQ